jgi:methylphosphotriester-DNA--protein-cysteine methyltransferase
MDAYDFMMTNLTTKLYAQGDTADECCEHGWRGCRRCEEGHIDRTERLAWRLAWHEKEKRHDET